MKGFTNLRIIIKPAGGLVIVLVLMGLIGCVGYFGLRRVLTEVAHAESVNHLLTAAKDVRLLEKDYLLLRDKRFYFDAHKLSQEIAGQIESMTVLADDPNERDLISKARNAASAYRESFDALAGLMDQQQAERETMLASARAFLAQTEILRDTQNVEVPTNRASGTGIAWKAETADRLMKLAHGMGMHEKAFALRADDAPLEENAASVKDIEALCDEASRRSDDPKHKELATQIRTSVRHYQQGLDAWRTLSRQQHAETERMVRHARVFEQACEEFRESHKENMNATSGGSKLIIIAGALAGIALGVLVSWEMAREQQRRSRELIEANRELRSALAANLRAQERLHASEKLGALGDMSARIAHEINNPLGAIKNAFYLVKDGVPAGHPYFKHVGLIDQQINRVQHIVRQMLDLYRPAAQKPRDFSLSALTQSILDLLTTKARTHGITLVHAPAAHEFQVHLPEAPVSQVLFNLLTNAIDATRHGGQVIVSLAEEADHVRVDIKDEGPGIPQAVRARMFEPFFTTKTEQAGGTGLGLPVSRSLVQAMGGRIDFECHSSGGTTFWFRLPKFMANDAVSSTSPDSPDSNTTTHVEI